MKILSIKIIYLFSLLFLFAEISFSQAPAIEWNNTIGGGATDDIYSMDLTSDGGYILGGVSGSNIFGDKTEPNIGFLDFWIVKLDSLGNLEWQNTIGGENTDNLRYVKQTSDGGYIVGGYSDSGISGDKSEANIGSYDYWILKLDTIGNIVWQNTIGGTSSDILRDIIQSQDGGYILAGTSSSEITGDKTESSWGESDYWVVKIDSIGNLIWQNTIGAAAFDTFYSFKQTSDGGYILGGSSDSEISGDKTETFYPRPDGLPSSDYWVVKIDAFGNVEWDEVIGGNDGDRLKDIQICNDGGYILGGESISGISFDKSEASYGNFDYWVIKINSVGEILWQKTIGGTSSESLNGGAYTFNKGYIIAGYSLSGLNGNKTDPNIGVDDYWIVKLDSLGNISWQTVIGGSDYDRSNSILQTPDGGYITGGWSASDMSATKSENCIGNSDFWVVKFFPDEECITSTFYADSDGDGFGNNLETLVACFLPTGYVPDNTDCNDLNSEINPDAIEICNSLDDDCNFIIDDGLPVYDYYYDADEDGYGDILLEINSCNDLPPAGYVIDNTDCDDTEDLIHEPILYYADTDGDLYGDELNSDLFCSIFPPIDYVTNNLDCNDLNILVNPASNEVCNNTDDNCNFEIDEGLPTQTLFIDTDNDNFGDAENDTISCLFPDGYVSDSTDCDDTNPDIYPGAPELLNGYDDNCNKLIDEGLAIEDFSNLQFMIYPVPATYQLTIVFNKISNGEIEIYNLLGEIILQQNIVQSNQTKLNISNLISGNYLIRFIDEDLNSGSQLFTKLKSE